MGHSDRSALTGRGICKTGYVTKKRYDIPVEPKAGKVGVFAVFVFGVLSIVAVFVAAYMWTGADTKLAGAMGVASILIPTIIGSLSASYATNALALCGSCSRRRSWLAACLPGR